MIALDTNVILSALNTAEQRHERSRAALVRLLQDQDAWVSPVVYAELRAGTNWTAVGRWLAAAGVGVRWTVDRAVWERAAQGYAEYVALRRTGTLPRRIPADFLIAAQAEDQQSPVLTYDDTVYRAVFPLVSVLVP